MGDGRGAQLRGLGGDVWRGEQYGCLAAPLHGKVEASSSIGPRTEGRGTKGKAAGGERITRAPWRDLRRGLV